MLTRFISNEGKEEQLANEHSFEEMVRIGRIGDDTLVWDSRTSAWRRAAELAEYRTALSNCSQHEQAGAGSESGVRPEARRDELVKEPCKVTSQKNTNLLLRVVPWILVLVSVLLVIYAAGRYGLGDSIVIASNLGQLSGHAVWIALVSFLLWRFAFKKRRGLGLLLFSGILLSLSAYKSVGLLSHVGDYRPVTRELRAIASDVASGSAIKSQGGSEPRGTGPVLAGFVSDYAAGLQSRFRALFGEIAAQQIDSMLGPKTLGDPARIRQARRGLRHVTEVLDAYEKSLRLYVDSARARALALSIPADEKAAFIAGWDVSVDSGWAGIGLWLDSQRSTVGQFDSMLAFMLDRQGRYTFSGGQVVFSSQEDVDRYNRYVQNLAALAQRREDSRAQVRGSFEGKLQRLERATGK